MALARVRSTLATGRIKSKETAADWALAQLPPEHHAALEHGRQLCLNCPYSEEG
ncbi:aminoglycoside adenylyltransferase domain-containing protein [Streptomyces sp. NPDC005329]|uniref:aminoglycoside adenylyltransferase domain-containing protein n=1 Tax=Streptomyces sp. NPDC005329 TaxID=3157034 RepID=UPI0033B4D91E